MDLITASDRNTNPFEQIKQVDDSGHEYWLTTDLLRAMGYKVWKRIKDTVERAKISAFNSGVDVSHHFNNVVQMALSWGSQAFREVLKDYKLSRYALLHYSYEWRPAQTRNSESAKLFRF
jgi:DNA-damage-inducible protein D